MRRRRSGKRKPCQWVVGTDTYATYLENSVAAANQFLSAQLLVGAQLGGNEPPTINRFTVNRVRGQILPLLSFNQSADMRCTLSMGIVVQTWVQSSLANVYPDPRQVEDGDRSWLWLHHMGFIWKAPTSTMVTTTYGVPVQAAGYSGTNIEVDVKSKRILQGDERLLLIYSINNSGDTPVSLPMWLWLRTLITRVA